MYSQISSKVLMDFDKRLLYNSIKYYGPNNKIERFFKNSFYYIEFNH